MSTWGSNRDSPELPFQGWRRFKEAFAPELVARAIEECELTVQAVVDPFCGSGTTALTAQFLGAHPVSVEINPYLADLAEAKLATYDLAAVEADFREAIRESVTAEIEREAARLPPTFREPGKKGRWIFKAETADQILGLRVAIERLEEPSHRRLFKALLGGVLVDVSNTRISGKGRRYRQNWAHRQASPAELLAAFESRTSLALRDLRQFGQRPGRSYQLVRDDSRAVTYEPDTFELSVFSPPYPNSFDYTDVYNIELWMLGYLESFEDNGRLRRSTLSSHVQVGRAFAAAPVGSDHLLETLSALNDRRDALWDPRIADMVGAYFSDLLSVTDNVAKAMKRRGEIWMIVGDSRYAGVDVPVATIMAELAPAIGLSVLRMEASRSMRASPQQGGAEILPETLLVLKRD
ncbi:DNA methyltransferase [Lysinimonas soli]|uniref:DNA methyltransferase n=1 Tax=Lysinimonas soli TaxID=1074233 RepID=A0ABW0NL60_9MICO